MLVLSRHCGEQIVIGDNIVVTVVDVCGDRVRLGIKCPRHIPVHRQEVYDRILKERLLELPMRRPGNSRLTPEYVL